MYNDTDNIDPRKIFLDPRFDLGAYKFCRFVKAKSGTTFGLLLYTPTSEKPKSAFETNPPTQWISIRSISSDGSTAWAYDQMTDKLDEVAKRVHQLH